MSSKALQILGIAFFFGGIAVGIVFMAWQPYVVGLVAFIACACADAVVNPLPNRSDEFSEQIKKATDDQKR